MTLTLGICGFIFLGYLAWRELRYSGLSAVSLALVGSAFFVWLGVVKYPLFEEQFRGSFSQSTVLYAILLTVMSQLIIFSGSLRLRVNALAARSRQEATGRRVDLPVFAVVCAFAGLAALMPTEGGYPVLVRGISQGMTIAALAVAVLCKQKTLAAALFLVLLVNLATGDYTSRRLYLAVFLPCIVIFLGNRRLVIGSAHGFKIAAALVALIFYLAYMRADHLVPEGMLKSSASEKVLYTLIKLRNIDTFWNTVFIVEHFSGDYDYYYGSTYLSVPLGLVPRSVWPGKPVGLGAPLGVLVQLGVRDFSIETWTETNQFSLSPGFVGEAYANFGFVGVIIASLAFRFLLGRISRKCVGPIGYGNSHWVTLTPVFFSMFRGDFYSAVNFSIFLFIGALAFNTIYSTRAPRRALIVARSGRPRL